jgi:AbrB family looped-hinge helix DNA binding protein
LVSVRFIKKVGERGTVTIPNDVREAMGVQEGDIVEFEIHGIAKKASGGRKA